MGEIDFNPVDDQGSKSVHGTIEKHARDLPQGVYLSERINSMDSLKSIHPQTRQLNYITRNIKIKLTICW